MYEPCLLQSPVCHTSLHLWPTLCQPLITFYIYELCHKVSNYTHNILLSSELIVYVKITEFSANLYIISSNFLNIKPVLKWLQQVVNDSLFWNDIKFKTMWRWSVFVFFKRCWTKCCRALSCNDTIHKKYKSVLVLLVLISLWHDLKHLKSWIQCINTIKKTIVLPCLHVHVFIFNYCLPSCNLKILFNSYLIALYQV